MKKFIIYSLFALLLSGCSHRIARSGYVKQAVSDECEVVIQKNISLPDTAATLVGGITLGETGISVTCNEATALETLKKEACSAGADLVLITQEKRPDFWSSCYRCKAEFYRFSTSEAKEYFSHPGYDTAEVKKRIKSDRGKNTVMAITAAITGYLVGSLMF